MTRTVLTSTSTDFHLHAQLDAYEGELRVRSLNWDRTIPRRPRLIGCMFSAR